jgi:hypothetical protein
VKRWHYIVLLVVVVVGIVYVYLHWQELGLGGSHGFGSSGALSADQALSSSRPAIINWQKVDWTPDGFKVDMPSDVKEIQIPAYNEIGGTDQVNMIFSYPNSETSFSVAWADDPPVVRVNNRVPDRILDMARDDALTRTQTTLVSESRITPGGFPARDFAARNVDGGVINSRLISAGSRLYMLIAAFPSANARRDQDVTRFFNSFTTTASASIPETMPAAPAPIR